MSEILTVGLDIGSYPTRIEVSRLLLELERDDA